MDIISRQEAKRLGMKFYFTGIPCKNNHISKRYTSNSTCVSCAKNRSEQWRRNSANREQYNLYQQAYSGHNLYFIRLYLRDPYEIWFDKRFRRRTALKKATPVWSDRQEIRRVYEECIRLSDQMGIAFEVDHEIPIHNKRVCGLHTHENLKIVSHSLNRIKGNKFNQEAVSRDLLIWLKERNL